MPWLWHRGVLCVVVGVENKTITQTCGGRSAVGKLSRGRRGRRRKLKKSYEYEVRWAGAFSHPEHDTWLTRDQLIDMGFEKLVNELDMKEASRAGLITRPLTQKVVEKHLDDLGIEAEFGTHSQMRGLSGAAPPFAAPFPPFQVVRRLCQAASPPPVGLGRSAPACCCFQKRLAGRQAHADACVGAACAVTRPFRRRLLGALSDSGRARPRAQAGRRSRLSWRPACG